MKPYQRQFIEFALNKQVLKFGEFTLKSGRTSPRKEVYMGSNNKEEKVTVKEELKEIKDKIVDDLKEVKDDFKESEKLFEKHPSSLE